MVLTVRYQVDFGRVVVPLKPPLCMDLLRTSRYLTMGG
jgi:hypothetical protein